MQPDRRPDQPHVASPLIMALYPLGVLTLLTLYANVYIFASFTLAMILIIVGSMIAVSSTRRYRQRLNYVEGLERAANEGERSERGEAAEALAPHWVDRFGDRGVGLNNAIMLALVVPTLLASAHQLESMHLFPAAAQVSADYGLSTWVTFVAIEIGGPIKLVFEYLGYAQLNEIAELGEQFSAPWKLFMAVVQVGLISLVFDVFRRYLDLNATLDRFASTALLSVDQLTAAEERLHRYLVSGDLEAHHERQLTNEYQAAQSDLHTRVDTLARLLTVFTYRRMVNRLARAVQSPELNSLSVEVSDEGRGQLLLALFISGARSGPLSLSARTAQQTALASLNVEAPVSLRLAALDVLGSYHPLVHPSHTLTLSAHDRVEAMMSAREQLRLGSAHSVSIELSIGYERLTLSSAFMLAAYGDRGALASLLMLRLSESKILKREGEQRLYHLLGRSTQRVDGALQQIVEIIGASERRDDDAVELAVSELISLLPTSSLGSASDQLDPHLVQQLINTLISELRSARALRSTVEKLSGAELHSLSVVLWAALQTRGVERGLRTGLIEGAQTSQRLYHEIGEHIIHTLRFGLPHEVRRNLEIIATFCDPDSFTLARRFMEEIDSLIAQHELEVTARVVTDAALDHQLFNLLSGLSRLNLSVYAERTRAWLDERSWSEFNPRIASAAELLYALVGDSERFSMLFADYLEGLEETSQTSAQQAAHELIHILDPHVIEVEAQWRALLTEARAGKVPEARQRAQELIAGVQESTTPVRVAWLWAFLSIEVHHTLRSPLLQRISTRAKHLNQAKLIPLTHENTRDWMLREVIRYSSSETHQGVMSQWLRLLGTIGRELNDEGKHVAISHLYRALDGELNLAQAGVRRAAAEAIGSINQTELSSRSAELIGRFSQQRSQGAQAGIARALLAINDEPARRFFAELTQRDHTLNADGFTAMSRALHQARDFDSLSHLLLDIERLPHRELSELLKPFGTSGLPPQGLREYLSDEALQVTRDLVLEKLRAPDVPATVVASCVGVIPQVVQDDDREISDELLKAVRDPELRQIDCERITNALSLAFPNQYMTAFDEVLDELTHNNRPKWILGMVHHDAERAVNLLLEIAEKYRDHPEQINPHNITALTGAFLKHGGSRGRRFVYHWLSQYAHIAYSIVRWVRTHGSRELDAPRLKDELYRNQRRLNQLELKSKSETADDEAMQQKLRAAAQLKVELLNALYQFGEESAFAELVKLATHKPVSYLDRVLKHEALIALPSQVRSLLSGDEADEVDE